MKSSRAPLITCFPLTMKNSNPERQLPQAPLQQAPRPQPLKPGGTLIGDVTYEPDTDEQTRLLEAFQEANDPRKLKEIIGVKTVAEVYRTLDKIAIRREFHRALDRAGISFDFIISGLKREAIGGDKSADRIKAFEIFLKALGLNKYEEVTTGTSTTWEERLLEAVNARKKEGKRVSPTEAVKLIETDQAWKSRAHDKPSPHSKRIYIESNKNAELAIPDYEVKRPDTPASVKEKEKEEKKVEDSLKSHEHPRP